MQGCGVGQGLAPAQQLQPASTKKEKSRELMAAPRNACASVSISVCAEGQLGPARVSSPPAASGEVPSYHQQPAQEGTFSASSAPGTVLGQGIHPVSVPRPACARGCQRTGVSMLGRAPSCCSWWGGQVPSSHDAVRLGTAKYTASSKRCASWGWGHAPGQCWSPPGLVWG